jgi:hypothetical protein
MLSAFIRRMCSKLYLKAESQQLDRILEEFARRYWECNPHTVYGSASTLGFLVCKSILTICKVLCMLWPALFSFSTLICMLLKSQHTCRRHSLLEILSRLFVLQQKPLPPASRLPEPLSKRHHQLRCHQLHPGPMVSQAK